MGLTGGRPFVASSPSLDSGSAMDGVVDVLRYRFNGEQHVIASPAETRSKKIKSSVNVLGFLGMS